MHRPQRVCSSASFTASRSSANFSMAYLCARATSAWPWRRTFSVSARARSHASFISAASASALWSGSSSGADCPGAPGSGVEGNVSSKAEVLGTGIGSGHRCSRGKVMTDRGADGAATRFQQVRRAPPASGRAGPAEADREERGASRASPASGRAGPAARRAARLRRRGPWRAASSFRAPPGQAAAGANLADSRASDRQVPRPIAGAR